MSDTKTRPAPPPLEYKYPDCSICGEVVEHDGDCLCCYTCDAYWPDDHSEGSWSDESAEQCASTHQPFAKNQYAEGKPYQYETRRCLRNQAHPGAHWSDPYTEWTDETAVNGMEAS